MKSTDKSEGKSEAKPKKEEIDEKIVKEEAPVKNE
jgi:hypothetical protein